MYMHGRVKKEGGDRLLPQKITSRATRFGQHMQSIPSPRISVEGKNTSLIVSTTASASSFSQDGRTISVGDCALFKPPHDSSPFIGTIRSLEFGEDKNLQLGVTWLYRPSEVKLGKGFFLDAAPNEIFYSFHNNEKIPAASLLHPCKVAFLPKGVELPKGVSSFVCRQVYDIDSKCLWWLTDKDYIDERQEEVNKLLNRTQKDMEQASGGSPTVTNGASNLKSASDNIPNSVTSAPSQIKGKKRDHSDQSYDHVKREHLSKADDSDSGTPRSVNRLRLEIAKITAKGGLVDPVSVEKLVELIRSRPNRKLDLGSRSMVSGVIAETDKCECLSQFVQLKGLSVLDEWLQDVNKGRLWDADNDKSVDEFLFVLLRALDKLPVNLNALQTCNIGRSVNHLRSRKNMEIQKKARSLVDKWKKQVEVEMNVIDSKSGSLTGGRTSGRSCEVHLKSPVSQPSESKVPSIKVSPREAIKKPACSSPGPIKSVSLTATDKEIRNRTVRSNGTDVPLSSHEDKNCLKEDSRSPVNISKISNVGSRHRKSVNGITETRLEPGNLKETVSGRSSLVHENASNEKSPQSVASHKLIVKIPNPNRSNVQFSIGVSGDLSVRDQDSMNCETIQANVASHVNIELLNGDDRKVLQARFDVDDRCSEARHDDLSKSVDESRKSIEGSRSPTSSSLKVKKLREASSTAMDALIESCAKYSEESASTSPRDDDDVGMNLLASVAVREVCSSEFDPLPDSVLRNAPTEEDNALSDGSMSKTCPPDKILRAFSGQNEVSTEHSRDIMACPDLSKGIKVINEKFSNAFSCISDESKKSHGADKKILDEKPSCLNAETRQFPYTEADGNGSSFAEVAISKGVTGEEHVKKVEQSSSSVSDEIDSKNVVENSMNPNLIHHGVEILQPTVSCKDVRDTFDEIDADKSCIDHKLLKESAFQTLVAKGDEKLKTSNLTDDKSEKKESGAVAVDSKLDFDLNEVFFYDDDVKYDEQPNNSGFSGPSLSVGPTSYPASTALASAAKGDIGWKGSTSCTRPLDIDLNVADESVLEDLTSQHSVDHLKFQHNSKNELNGFSAMDLDLNRVDDSRLNPARDVPFKPLFSANDDVKRDFDFDLNNGPCFDGLLLKHSNLPFSGLRPNGLKIDSNPYSSLTTNPLMSDMYRAAVLPSLPYQMFPLPSSSYLDNPVLTPTINSHFLSPNNAVGLQYPKPFVTGLDLNADGESQLLVSGSNTRVESLTGRVIKRKEPEGGGLDRENLRYKKQPSWH